MGFDAVLFWYSGEFGCFASVICNYYVKLVDIQLQQCFHLEKELTHDEQLLYSI
jgi:hypothetical protein